MKKFKLKTNISQANSLFAIVLCFLKAFLGIRQENPNILNVICSRTSLDERKIFLLLQLIFLKTLLHPIIQQQK
jgi:hypothetical protein